jgi:hypothetical protein
MADPAVADQAVVAMEAVAATESLVSTAQRGRVATDPPASRSGKAGIRAGLSRRGLVPCADPRRAAAPNCAAANPVGA